MALTRWAWSAYKKGTGTPIYSLIASAHSASASASASASMTEVHD